MGRLTKAAVARMIEAISIECADGLLLQCHCTEIKGGRVTLKFKLVNRALQHIADLGQGDISPGMTLTLANIEKVELVT